MDANGNHPLVPYLVGAAVALVVAGTTYAAVWVQDVPDPVNATTGEARSFTFPEGERADETVSWETRLRLEEAPSTYEVQVLVPYRVEVTPPDANGTRYQLDVHVNGEQAASYHLRPGTGGLTVHRPGPHLDTTALREGTNTIVAVANLQRTPDLAGDNRLEIGPLIAEAHPQDADGDGIADARQPIAGLPTPLLAVVGGLLAAVPATVVTRRTSEPGQEGGS